MKPVTVVTKLIPVLLLSGSVLVGAGLTMSEAIARPATPGQVTVANAGRNASFPRRISNRVRRDLADHLNVSRRTLRVVNAVRQEFSDSCLGLGNIDELCAASAVDGWRVEVTDGEQRWFYRTSLDGRTMRYETPTISGFPDQVRDRVLEAASEASGIPSYRLTVMDAESRVWNGCLGIQPPGMMCTEIAIDGWRVVVSGEDQVLILHTNSDGSDVRVASQARI